MGLPRAYQPDAVYWNKLKEPVAFELEISRKTKRLYENKIRKYVDLIRQSEVNGGGFRAVLFVVTHDAIFEVLSELTRRFEGKFRIEKFNDLLAQAAKEREVT